MDAAIFDVDGTICHTRSGTALKWLRARQQAPLPYALWVASLAWRVPFATVVDRFSRTLTDRLVYQQYAGLSLSRAQADAQRCCDELLLPNAFPGALAEIDLHRRAGRRIVLVTGNVDLVMAPLARALGADLIAQRLAADGDRLTGEYLSYEALGDRLALPHGDAKAAALARHAERTGIDLRRSTAYGDSVHDVPMLELAGTPVAVRPDARLRRVAAARGWEVRRW